jgi:hypothetical protein
MAQIEQRWIFGNHPGTVSLGPDDLSAVKGRRYDRAKGEVVRRRLGASPFELFGRVGAELGVGTYTVAE